MASKGLQLAKDAEMDSALGLVRTRKHARRTAVAPQRLIKPSTWQNNELLQYLRLIFGRFILDAQTSMNRPFES